MRQFDNSDAAFYLQKIVKFFTKTVDKQYYAMYSIMQ